MAPHGGDVLLTKRVLIELSHAIEQFALAANSDEPLVVIALFQRFSYFRREEIVYRDIAARPAVAVVCVVEDFPPELPPGVRHWNPRFGALAHRHGGTAGPLLLSRSVQTGWCATG